MKISENEIKRISSQTIYKRGLEYFKDGRVHIKSREENLLTALVDGEEIYSVNIGFDGEKIINSYCTCPYFRTMDTTCKHIVATLKKRQAEIEAGENFKDENDRLAQSLCAEFADNCFEKPKLMMGFCLNIFSGEDRKCSYMIQIKCGFDELKEIDSVDGFLECFINKTDYKISKHKSINSAKYSLSENDGRIMDILCEVYQNKARGYYNMRISQLALAQSTVKRLLPLLQMSDCYYTYNSLALREVRFIEDDPDILIDINATDSEISLNISESGTAMFDDGSWFLYENCFYRTDEEWQSWFMPIYRALTSESRTQIDFKADTRIDFATYVYPKLRNKRGVVTTGLESMLINEKPKFSVYLEYQNNYLKAVIQVTYGSINIQIPNKGFDSDKIIIRDIEAEKKVISFFSAFSVADNTYYLYDDESIYEFISKTVNDIKEYAKVYANDKFDDLFYGKEISIKTRVDYKKDIDLLEVGFETDLSYDDIYGILNSIRYNEKYYRFKDGSFLDVDKIDKEGFLILDNLNFTRNDIKNMSKKLSLYHMLYIDALKKEGVMETDSAFDELIGGIKKIKVKIPKSINDVLRPYQKVAVNWLKQLSELGFGGILADDMGLGKTLEVIAFVMSEKRDKPVLVVSPSSLTYNWVNEINKFAKNATAIIVEGSKEDRKEILTRINDYDFVITSYPLLRRDHEMYSEYEFSYMFIDEAQNIKNSDTMNAKSVKRIKADRKFALSGTPIENGLSELWSVFDFVMKGYLYTKKEFLSIFEDSQEERDSIKELRKKIKPFILRRMKSDVLKELPEKIENTVYSELMPEQKNMYEAFRRAAKSEIGTLINERDSGMRILTILLRLRQICCHPALFDVNYKKDSGKLQLFTEIVESAISQGHRVLVFSQFTSMLEIIRSRLLEIGIKCFYIDGKTPVYMRSQLAEQFNGGEGNIFLISLKAGGTGLNLTGADMVIHYDPWWNPAVMDQASDRAYRIGQTKAVQVIRLATRGTIEEQIMKLQESKKDLADRVIKKNEKTISGLTRNEILALFED